MSRSNVPGKTAFLFPGQGAVPETGLTDFIGTAVEENYNLIRVRKSYQLAGFHQQNINSDKAAQSGVFALSLAMGLEAARYCRPDLVSGYSSGLYAALVAGGCLTPDQGNHAISLAYKGASQAGARYVMVGVIGLGLELVQDILKQLPHPGSLSLVNNKSQVIVSISKDDISTFQDMCGRSGALRVIVLPFKYPYHVSGLKNTGKKLHEYFRSLHLPPLKIPMVAGVKPEFIKEDSRRAADLVASQLYQTVWWQETIHKMMLHGAETLVVFDPTETLTRIIRWISRQVNIIGITSPDDFTRLPEL